MTESQMAAEIVLLREQVAVLKQERVQFAKLAVYRCPDCSGKGHHNFESTSGNFTVLRESCNGHGLLYIRPAVVQPQLR